MTRKSHSITPRETQVCALISEGYSTKEIAAALTLSPDTVKVYVGRILLKTGCPNRAAIAARYVQGASALPTPRQTATTRRPRGGRKK